MWCSGLWASAIILSSRDAHAQQLRPRLPARRSYRGALEQSVAGLLPARIEPNRPGRVLFSRGADFEWKFGVTRRGAATGASTSRGSLFTTIGRVKCAIHPRLRVKHGTHEPPAQLQVSIRPCFPLPTMCTVRNTVVSGSLNLSPRTESKVARPWYRGLVSIVVRGGQKPSAHRREVVVRRHRPHCKNIFRDLVGRMQIDG